MWFCCETLSFKFQAINGRALHWNLPQVCLCFLDFNSLCRQINKQTNTYSHTITTNWQVWWRLSHLLFLARSFSFFHSQFSSLSSSLAAYCSLQDIETKAAHATSKLFDLQVAASEGGGKQCREEANMIATRQETGPKPLATTQHWLVSHQLSHLRQATDSDWLLSPIKAD